MLCLNYKKMDKIATDAQQYALSFLSFNDYVIACITLKIRKNYELFFKRNWDRRLKIFKYYFSEGVNDPELIKYFGEFITDKHLNNWLYLACSNNDLDRIKYICENYSKEQLKLEDKCGSFLQYGYKRWKKLPILKYLNEELKVQFTEKSLSDALDAASAWGKIEVINYLHFEMGAKITGENVLNAMYEDKLATSHYMNALRLVDNYCVIC